MHSSIVIFAGPSLYGTGLKTSSGPDIEWRPPARRGDIEAIVNASLPGAIALADGTFHSYPSVSHVEIREAIDAGWIVFGLCSMGAIRAAEMAHMGMRPWGLVAEHFCRQIETPDDEVALIHGSEWPYIHLSEPLIHIRAFLAYLVNSKLLSIVQASTIAARLAAMWYGDRTLRLLEELIVEGLGGLSPQVDRQLKEFHRFRLKQQDLKAFVDQQPWLIA